MNDKQTFLFDILEPLAENGTAPARGCSTFGVGYNDTFDQLCKVYVDGQFKRGKSAEKFVIGPFGSGKSHFLRHFMEIAETKNCVTAEVALSKDVDFTKSLLVYKEVAREIGFRGEKVRGISAFLEKCVEKIMDDFVDSPDEAEEMTRSVIKALDRQSFKDNSFGRAAQQALQASIDNDQEKFQQLSRWLGGEVGEAALARQLGFSRIAKAEEARYGLHALLSLCQLARHVGFRGTVICFDEAEQGFDVGKKQKDKILSMLKSSIDASQDVEGGSLLMLYAVTPDIVEEMMDFAALQQRIEDPAEGRGFFDGNAWAPKIDLTESPSRSDDPVKELSDIGTALVNLLYDCSGEEIEIDRAETIEHVKEVARQVAETDVTLSNRRSMVKQVATELLHLHETGRLEFGASRDEGPEPEV